jgi:type IX secretion system PorP/SprF family membrane protein
MKKIILWLLLLNITFALQAQDILFSQFYNAPLMHNPAFAGIMNTDLRIIGNNRSQWAGFGKTPFSTSASSIEVKLGAPRNVTVGAQLISDRAGDAGFRRTQILPVVSAFVSFNDNTFLNAAFMGGPVTTGFDATQLYFDDQYVPGVAGPGRPTNTTFSNTNKTYLDLSGGVVLNQNFDDGLSWYLGAGIYHANGPDVGFTPGVKTKLPARLGFNAGFNLPLNDKDILMLQGDYFYQNRKGYAQAGAMYKKSLAYNQSEDEARHLSAGVFVRWNDVLIPTVQMEVTKNFTLGLSYDVTISNQPRVYNVRNGLELSLIYNANIRSRNALPCPKFF